MNKVATGYIRVIIYLTACYFFDIPSIYEVKLYITDLYYGEYSQEYRDSGLVHFSMFLILSVLSFYIIQTIIYIFVGHALQNRNTSPFNLLRHVWKAILQIKSDKYFWTSDSTSCNFRNIDELLSYRDNKMAMMSNADAAVILKKTSHIDTLRGSADLPQSKKVLSYLNNKVALMDNESALKYIQNRKD